MFSRPFLLVVVFSSLSLLFVSLSLFFLLCLVLCICECLRRRRCHRHHRVRQQGEDSVEYFLGLTPSGIVVLRDKTTVAYYYWPRITKVYFKGRYFMLRVCDKSVSFIFQLFFYVCRLSVWRSIPSKRENSSLNKAIKVLHTKICASCYFCS